MSMKEVREQDSKQINRHPQILPIYLCAASGAYLFGSDQVMVSQQMFNGSSVCRKP